MAIFAVISVLSLTVLLKRQNKMAWLFNNPIGDRWDEKVRYYAELYDKEVLKGTLTKERLFEISSVLVRSNCSQYMRRAIDVLEHLCTSADSKATHKSYLIYLTIGYIRLAKYELAENCLKQLKIIDPHSRQEQELEYCLVKHQRSNPRLKENKDILLTARSPERFDQDRDDERDVELKRLLSSHRD